MAGKKKRAVKRGGSAAEIKPPRGTKIEGLHQVYGRTVVLTKHEKKGHIDGYVVGKSGKLLRVYDGAAEASGTGRPVTSTAYALQAVSHFLNHFPVGDE